MDAVGWMRVWKKEQPEWSDEAVESVEWIDGEAKGLLAL